MCMGGGPNPGKPAEPPPPPEPAKTPSTANAVDALLGSRTRRRGMSGTIATSPMGLVNAPNTGYKSLLGS